MLSAVIAPEILPAWAFKQRKAALVVMALYNSPAGMFFWFEVNNLLKYCSEYLAEERAVAADESLERRKGRCFAVAFVKRLIKGKVPGGSFLRLSLWKLLNPYQNGP